MSRRSRAVTFAVLALFAAVAAAVVANGYGSSIARGFGPLRPAVVAKKPLGEGKAIDPDAIETSLEIRRIPVRFVPPGTLSEPSSALGLEPQAAVPAGSYVLAQQLRPPEREKQTPGLVGGRQPVDIAVSGGDALLAAGPGASGGLVDVVVTTEPEGAGPGRTYVAAEGVPLLGITAGADGPGPGATSTATLALFRPQALRLIAAQNFARQVTLLPGSHAG